MEVAVVDFGTLKSLSAKNILSGETLSGSEHFSSSTIVQSFSSAGLGVVAIRGVPGVEIICTHLLPVALEITALQEERRKIFLKECSLGTDVPLKDPARNLSSYACNVDMKADCSGITWPTDVSLQDRPAEEIIFGEMLRQSARSMASVAAMVARVCDYELSGSTRLEEAMTAGGTAKARLIHYHSAEEVEFLKQEALKKPRSSKRSKTLTGQRTEMGTLCDSAGNSRGKEESGGCVSSMDLDPLWQPWHSDFGLFTVLSPPLYQKATTSEQGGSRAEPLDSPPDCQSGLQVFSLRTGVITPLEIPRGCVAVQVGDAAQILSGGQLRAVPHSVRRPIRCGSGADSACCCHISREMLAVFTQPAWDFPMEPPEGFSREDVLFGPNSETAGAGKLPVPGWLSSIPSLASRWDGGSFSAFSQETTKRYYGSKPVGRQKTQKWTKIEH